MRFWTEERTDQLRRLVLSGASGGQIASLLGCTRNAVISKINRLGMNLANARDPSFGPRVKRARQRAAASRKPFITPSRQRDSKPKASAYVPEYPGAPGADAVPFNTRKPFQCAWIFDDPVSATSLCCGKPIAENSRLSFCPAHTDRAKSKANPPLIYRKDAA